MRTEDQLRELLGTYKMSMQDIEPDVSIQHLIHLSLTYDTFQLKYDGWFTLVDFCDGIMRVMTSGGDIRLAQNVDYRGTSLFLCEWMYGTNWSQKPGRKGKFIIFDAFEIDGIVVSIHCLSARNIMIADFIEREGKNLGQIFMAINNWKLEEFDEIWNSMVNIEDGFEGIVWKKESDFLSPGMSLGRMKKEVDMDYVIIGFNEGKNRLDGTLGSIIGGLYINGSLTPVCTVGGGFDDGLRAWVWANRDQLMGRVMKVYGKVRFSTGALRHPAIDQKRGWLREDKRKEECVFHTEWGK
jgi:hypothetical protein